MIAEVDIGGATWRVDLGRGRRLSIPVGRDGNHPRFFVDSQVRFEPLASGAFTGRVATGGSCNAESVTLIPHCHGTHTEGVGHITAAAEPVQDRLENGLIPARLVTVTPTTRTGPDDTAAGPGPVIPAAGLEWPEAIEALIIRTRPNDPDKCQRHYGESAPYPLLSVEAMQAIVSGGIRHLLIDTPSVDAADDGGELAQHRRFWGLGPGAVEASGERAGCTITEMIYAPDDLPDGRYLLSLGVSALVGEAAPSSPMVYAAS